MVRLEGDRDFTLGPDELFARLTNPRFLVECIPDVEKASRELGFNARVGLEEGLRCSIEWYRKHPDVGP